MQRYVLLSVIPSDFSKMMGLANLLRKNGHEVAFYFEQRSHDLSESIARASSENFPIYSQTMQGLAKKSPRPTSRATPRRPATRRKSITTLAVFIKRLFAELRSVQRTRASFSQMAQSFCPTVLIVPTCSAGYNLPVYLQQSGKLNLVTVCMPFAIGDTNAARTSIRFSMKSAPDYLLNRFFHRIFRRWYQATETGDYPVLPAEVLVAYRLAKIDVTFPLSFYGARVDYLLLENEYMATHAKTQSVDAGTVAVTGSIFDDQLVFVRDNRLSHYTSLCRNFSWDPSRRLVCIALPPLVDGNYGSLRFRTFADLMEAFVPHALDWSSVNVLIGLHPRMRTVPRESYSFPDNMRSITEPLELLMPLADVLVATYSSTIRTAIALGTPVINFDVLSFGYELFDDLPGIVRVVEDSDYHRALTGFLQNDGLYESLLEELRMPNSLGSTLDGDSGKRIVTALTLPPIRS